MTTLSSHGVPEFRARVRQWYDRSAVKDLFQRLGELDFVNTIMMFGAGFLLSTLPLVVLMSSFASRRVEDGLAHHLGLNEAAAKIVEQQFHPSPEYSVVAVTIALLLGFAGTMAVASSVQAIYQQIFRAQPVRHGNIVRLLVWLAGMTVWLLVDAVIAIQLHGVPGAAVMRVLAVWASTALLFWWSMHMLLAGQVPWRSLRLPAVFTGLFWIGLSGFAALYFSSTITTDNRLYGNIGVVFSLLTWFIAVAAVVVLGALVGQILHERRAKKRA